MNCGCGTLKLGQALAKLNANRAPSSIKLSLPTRQSSGGILAALKLDKMIALEAQRIGALPDSELERR